MVDVLPSVTSLKYYSESIGKCQEEASIFRSALYTEHQTFSPSETSVGNEEEEVENGSDSSNARP